jgi:hypothetical protein
MTDARLQIDIAALRLRATRLLRLATAAQKTGNVGHADWLAEEAERSLAEADRIERC